MTTIECAFSGAERAQHRYARLAGFLFLWLIISGLAGALTISHIVGSGTFAETEKRVAASEHLYRVALSSELIETLSTVLLAFALYVTLKPIDKLLAQIAMYCRLGETFRRRRGRDRRLSEAASLHFPTVVRSIGTRPVTGHGGPDTQRRFRHILDYKRMRARRRTPTCNSRSMRSLSLAGPACL